MRAVHPGKGKVASAGLTSLLARLELDRQTAMEAQRIGTLPTDEFENALKPYRGTDYFATFDQLVKLARPYWYKKSSERKHRAIRAQARSRLPQLQFNPQPQKLGPPCNITRGRRGTRS